jgi:hypothetical protein
MVALSEQATSAAVANTKSGISSGLHIGEGGESLMRETAFAVVAHLMPQAASSARRRSVSVVEVT